MSRRYGKKIYVDILIGLTFFGLVGTYYYDHFLVEPKIKIKQRPVVVTQARDILKTKVQILDSALNTTATSSACTIFLKSSAEKSIDEYVNEFIQHNNDGIIKTCTGAIPALLQHRIDKALLECKLATLDKITKECYAALIDAKSGSVATIIKADANPNDLAPSILLQLIANRFSSGEFMEHPERSLEIVDALLDKEPSYLSGHKVKLLLLSASSLNKDEYYKDIFQDTLDEARRLNPEDPEVMEIAIAEKGNIFKNTEANAGEKKNNTEFLEYLEQESKKHPKAWIYDYYRANTVYDSGNGDHQLAINLVEKSLKQAPGDMRLKQTLENLKSNDEQKRKHPFSVSIGFSLNDF